MGTNYYARIIPTAEEKQELIDAINNDNPNAVEELSQKLYGHRDEYTGKGNIIHLGKRSSGWKFLWNANVIDVWNNDTQSYQNEYLYPLTKKGIFDFLTRNDVVIFDECGKEWSPEEFFNMALNWCKDGLDSKEYQTNPKYDAPAFYGDNERNNKWKKMGYKVEYYDFYSDGLCFSTSIYFS